MTVIDQVCLGATRNPTFYLIQLTKNMVMMFMLRIWSSLGCGTMLVRKHGWAQLSSSKPGYQHDMQKVCKFQGSKHILANNMANTFWLNDVEGFAEGSKDTMTRFWLTG